jgi:hypothetical protein
MTKRALNRIGYTIAGLTFVLAMFIMFAHYHGFKGDYDALGIMFLFGAFVVNLAVLIIMVVLIYGYKIKGPFLSIGFMFANIPVAIIYISFGIYLNDFYRVTVINDNQSTLSNIRLTGCEYESIEKLESGESETVWIEIEGDCSVHLTYIDSKKNEHNESVMGYLCPGLGGTEDYFIRGKSSSK